MSIKVIDLDSCSDRTILDGLTTPQTRSFLASVRKSIDKLDTLGQLQAFAGLSMADKSRDTFELIGMLRNYLSQLEYNE